jgi:hypothetical protein
MNDSVDEVSSPLAVVHAMAAQKSLRIFEVRVPSVHELGQILEAAAEYGFDAKYDESTGIVRLHRLNGPRDR